MRSDNDEIEDILHMSKEELLIYVFENPEYLNDPYYSNFRDALRKRFNDLYK